MKWTLASIAAVAVWYAPAGAQCRVPIGSNEGKLLAFYEVPLIFAPAVAPENAAAGQMRLSLEVEYLPKPNAEIQRTGACFTRLRATRREIPTACRRESSRLSAGGTNRGAANASAIPITPNTITISTIVKPRRPDRASWKARVGIT